MKRALKEGVEPCTEPVGSGKETEGGSEVDDEAVCEGEWQEGHTLLRHSRAICRGHLAAILRTVWACVEGGGRIREVFCCSAAGRLAGRFDRNSLA